jgi:hypothetical protein
MPDPIFILALAPQVPECLLPAVDYTERILETYGSKRAAEKIRVVTIIVRQKNYSIG